MKKPQYILMNTLHYNRKPISIMTFPLFFVQWNLEKCHYQNWLSVTNSILHVKKLFLTFFFFSLVYFIFSGLIGISASEMASNCHVSRKGWRRTLMDWYSCFGLLIFWAAGFRIKVNGQQASRAEAPILVGAPHR